MKSKSKSKIRSRSWRKIKAPHPLPKVEGIARACQIL